MDTPPAVTGLRFAGNTTTSASVVWDKPTIYHLGLLDRTVPFITGLTVKVYKNDDSGATSLGASVDAVSAGDTEVTGIDSGTAVAAGDSVTLESTNSYTVSASGTAVTAAAGGTFKADLTAGQDIVIAGSQKRRVLTVVSDTECTVAPAFASALTDQSWTKAETRVVSAVDTNSLTVHRGFSGAITPSTTTFRSYEAAATKVETLSTVTNLPREDATAVVEAATLFMDGGSSGVSGLVEGKHNLNLQSTDFSNTDLLKFEIFYTNHNDNLDDQPAFAADIQFQQPGVPGPPSNLTSSSVTATEASLSLSLIHI